MNFAALLTKGRVLWLTHIENITALLTKGRVLWLTHIGNITALLTKGRVLWLTHIGNITALLTKGRILWLTHIGATYPLAWLAFDYFADNLSVNPIQDLTLRTGKPALVLLILSLSCTPLNTVLGWRNIIAARKWLGLWAFSYAAIHFLIFIWVDYALQWMYILQDVGTKLYVIVGFSALLILLPLALTSTKGWMRRLGKTWKKIHQFVYAAGVLAVFHFVWVVKSDYREPAAWGVLLGFFLLVRIPAVRKRIPRWRAKLRGGPPRPRPKATRSPA